MEGAGTQLSLLLMVLEEQELTQELTGGSCSSGALLGPFWGSDCALDSNRCRMNGVKLN